MILNFFPELDGVWFTMDGLKVSIQQAKNYYIQLAFYNGWLHYHFVGNIFVFAPSGITSYFSTLWILRVPRLQSV